MLFARKNVLCGVAAAAGLLVAIAVSTPADAADPEPGESGQVYVAPDDLISQQDPQLRQLRLDEFNGWIASRSEVGSSGYIASVFDVPNLAITVLWHGGDSAFRQKIVAEGALRGITVRFEARKQSLAQTEAAARAILESSGSGVWRDFQIDNVAGITADYDGVTVRATYRPGFAASAASTAQATADAASAAAAQLGVAVRVEPGMSMKAAVATRSNDSPAFNAGGYMYSPSGGNGCSTGFAIWISGVSHTTTARHCNRNDYRAHDGTAVYGSGTNMPDGAARYLSGAGLYWMFDGAWNDATGYKKTVTGFADVGISGEVCTSGGNSGVHCGIVINALSVMWNDGYGAVSTIQGHQKFNQIAAIQGDSGGPVLVPAGTGFVHADGMIQAVGNPIANCGSVHDLVGLVCSDTVFLTAMRTIVNAQPGASLRVY